METFTPGKSARAKRSNARAWLQIAAAAKGKSDRFFYLDKLDHAARSLWGGQS